LYIENQSNKSKLIPIFLGYYLRIVHFQLVSYLLHISHLLLSITENPKI
jgi:hypothetical protein